MSTERDLTEGAAGGGGDATGPGTLPTVANPHKKIIFFICAIALFMPSVDQTIVATALPRISTSLHARLNWLGWTITIYSLGQVIMLPIAGKIGDQIGRKRLFLICVTLFTATSVVCGLSVDIYMLVPLRFLQSLGGAALMPSASSIVAENFGRDRDKALGMFSSILPIGGVAGPVFGGIITQYWSWRGIFFVNLPIGIVLFALIVRFIPWTAKRARGPLDLSGIALLALTIVLGMVAVTTLGSAHATPSDTAFWLPACCSALVAWRFVRHVKRVEWPIIPIRLLRGKIFGTMNLINVCFGGAGFGFGVLLPLYAEKRYHIALASAGTVLSAQALGQTLVAAMAAMLLRRTGYRWPMAAGFTIVAFGLLMLSISPPFTGPYLWLSAVALLSGVGLGWVAPAANNATLALAPDQIAAITGLRATFRSTGSIMCVSAATAIVARSSTPGLAEAHFFWILAGVLAVATALTFTIPDRRGSW